MKRALVWTGALIAACSGQAVVDPVASSGGAGGTGGTQSASSTSGSGTSTSTSSSGTSTSTSGTSTSSSTSSSGNPGCNDAPCLPATYCDWGDNLCGAGEPGECALIPDLCIPDLVPTCGCDGQVHANPCEAAIQGVDVSNAEICPPPLDMVPCGWRFCAYGTDYCLVLISDIGGWPDEYDCAPLPPGCSGSNADCSCMASEPCSDWCEQDPDGSITLTCPGG